MNSDKRSSGEAALVHYNLNILWYDMKFNNASKTTKLYKVSHFLAFLEPSLDLAVSWVKLVWSLSASNWISFWPVALTLFFGLFYGTWGKLQFVLKGFTICHLWHSKFLFKVPYRAMSIYISRMAGSHYKIKT